MVQMGKQSSSDLLQGPLPRVARAEWTAYWLTAVFLVLGLSWLGVRHSTAWQPFVICLVTGVAWAGWIGSFRITLDKTELTYRTLFAAHTIQHADIQTLATKFALDRAGLILLVIQPKDSERPIRVNMKPFRRADLALLIDTIRAANPSVEITPGLQKLRTAQFSIVKARLRKDTPEKA